MSEPPWLEVRLRHHGRGIPPERVPHVFTRPETLGVLVSRALMERHHGRIWAESDGAEMGARFSLALPLASRGS